MMLNHARCLLANLPPLNAFGLPAIAGHVAEEIVDPGFRPVVLPSAVVAARQALFGESPDRDMINYRCRQLLTVVHCTPLADWIYALDPRVTYSVGKDASLLPTSLFRPAISLVAGEGSLAVSGRPEPPDAAGRMFRSYLISREDGTVSWMTPAGESFAVDADDEDGLSASVPLLGSGYDVRLPAGSDGSSWLFEVRNRPQWDLGQLAAVLGSLGSTVLDTLFAGRFEPWPTLRASWDRQDELPGRLGAAVLAIVYRTEEARRGS